MKYLALIFLATFVFSIKGESSEDLCSLPSVSGICNAYFPKFFYDHEKGECSQFIYGGCQGNGNRFDTKEECEKTCGGH